MVETALMIPGFRGLCIREVQKSLRESAKLLIEDKIHKFGVSDRFECQSDVTRTPGGGVIIYRGMQDYNAESIKSLEGFQRVWNEESQTTSKRSLELLRPTIRAPGSELWFSWNPRSPLDPIDKFFCGAQPPPDSKLVNVSYKDNPFFPKEMELERQYDHQFNRSRYAHIWEGDYEPAVAGAIWDRASIDSYRLSDAPPLERIVVAVDPAISSGEGADEHGISVCGRGEDRNGYMLEDAACRGTPEKWARRAIAAYDSWQADAIVIEVNQGGDMVTSTLQSVRRNIRIIPVHAARGKHVRAEPIAALYNQGRIRHCGTFPELETQMCQMTNAGFEGDGSPDRVDALVWGFTELFPSIVRKGSSVQPTIANTHFKVFA